MHGGALSGRHLPMLLICLTVATLIAVVLARFMRVSVPSDDVGIPMEAIGSGTVLNPSKSSSVRCATPPMTTACEERCLEKHRPSAQTASARSRMIVCSCNVLSDHEIRCVVTAAREQPLIVHEVYRCLGCSMRCGRCAAAIKLIITEGFIPSHLVSIMRQVTGGDALSRAPPCGLHPSSYARDAPCASISYASSSFALALHKTTNLRVLIGRARRLT
jgi:bacterioferritin-associated ferredoxin